MTGAPPHQELGKLGGLQVCHSVHPCPGKVQARGGARTSHRALRRKSRTWTSCITGWGGRSRGVRYHSGMPQSRIRVVSGKSGAFSTGALELESKAWLKVSPLRLSFLVHKMRDLDLPGPQVPSEQSFLRLLGCWALIFIHSAHSGLGKLPGPSSLQHPCVDEDKQCMGRETDFTFHRREGSFLLCQWELPQHLSPICKKSEHKGSNSPVSSKSICALERISSTNALFPASLCWKPIVVCRLEGSKERSLEEKEIPGEGVQERHQRKGGGGQAEGREGGGGT